MEAVKDFGGVANWVLTLLFANNAMYVKAKYVHSTQQTKQLKKTPTRTQGVVKTSD